MIFAVFDPSPLTLCIHCSFFYIYNIHYRQHCAQRKAPLIYSEADFEFFFAPQERHVAPMGMKFGTKEWSNLHAKFQPIDVTIRV